MKKQILLVTATAAAISGAGYFGYQQLDIVPSRGEPKVSESLCRMSDNSQKEGWNFEYKLAPPRQVGPNHRELFDRTVCVPKGEKSSCLAFNVPRLSPVNTVEEARAEAELCADIIENVKR